jgi:nitrate/nitrite transporter NarK
MLAHMGWRRTFWIFGVVGIVWAVFFWAWFRDTPREKGSVNAAEVELIEKGLPPAPPGQPRVPWGVFLRSANLWALCLQYFGVSYGWWFYITWLPTYLKYRGVSVVTSGIVGGLPLFFGGLGAVLGGLLADYAVKKTGTLKTKRYIGFGAFLVGSTLMMASVWLSSAVATVTVMATATFFADLVLGSSWSTCMDIGQEFSGTVAGCMNTFGNLAGFLFPIVTAFIFQHFGRWDLPIMVSATLFFLGALMWLRVDPTEVLVPHPAKAS